MPTPCSGLRTMICTNFFEEEIRRALVCRGEWMAQCGIACVCNVYGCLQLVIKG
ncbi:hypothetical protein M3J09_004016 [Ascochyta lentis]